MSRTCTAAVFDGTGTGFSFNTFQLEPIAEGDVLVEVAACALCGSDLHTIAGRRTCSGPTVLGHEIVGRVIENGGAVADWSGQALEPGDDLHGRSGQRCRVMSVAWLVPQSGKTSEL